MWLGLCIIDVSECLALPGYMFYVLRFTSSCPEGSFDSFYLQGRSIIAQGLTDPCVHRCSCAPQTMPCSSDLLPEIFLLFHNETLILICNDTLLPRSPLP